MPTKLPGFHAMPQRFRLLLADGREIDLEISKLTWRVDNNYLAMNDFSARGRHSERIDLELFAPKPINGLDGGAYVRADDGEYQRCQISSTIYERPFLRVQLMLLYTEEQPNR